MPKPVSGKVDQADGLDPDSIRRSDDCSRTDRSSKQMVLRELIERVEKAVIRPFLSARLSSQVPARGTWP